MISIYKKILAFLVVLTVTFTAGTSNAYAGTYDQVYYNLLAMANACRNVGYTNTANCLENAICSYEAQCANVIDPYNITLFINDFLYVY